LFIIPSESEEEVVPFPTTANWKFAMYFELTCPLFVINLGSTIPLIKTSAFSPEFIATFLP